MKGSSLPRRIWFFNSVDNEIRSSCAFLGFAREFFAVHADAAVTDELLLRVMNSPSRCAMVIRALASLLTTDNSLCTSVENSYLEPVRHPPRFKSVGALFVLHDYNRTDHPSHRRRASQQCGSARWSAQLRDALPPRSFILGTQWQPVNKRRLWSARAEPRALSHNWIVQKITPGLSLALIGNASGKTLRKRLKLNREAFSMRRLGGSRWRLRRTRGMRLAMEFEWSFFRFLFGHNR